MPGCAGSTYAVVAVSAGASRQNSPPVKLWSVVRVHAAVTSATMLPTSGLSTCRARIRRASKEPVERVSQVRPSSMVVWMRAGSPAQEPPVVRQATSAFPAARKTVGAATVVLAVALGAGVGLAAASVLVADGAGAAVPSSADPPPVRVTAAETRIRSMTRKATTAVTPTPGIMRPSDGRGRRVRPVTAMGFRPSGVDLATRGTRGSRGAVVGRASSQAARWRLGVSRHGVSRCGGHRAARGRPTLAGDRIRSAPRRRAATRSSGGARAADPRDGRCGV